MRRPALAVLAILLGGCAPAERGLVIGAAASLAGLLPELTSAFEAESGLAVTTTLGASGILAQQIRQGAPIDLYLSADGRWVDELATDGHILPHSRAVYARGRLALWSRDPALPLTSVQDLSSPAIGRVAIAGPGHAPYGRAAEEALRAAGIYEAVQPRLIIAEHVRQALQFAETGNVDAAFVPAMLVRGRRGTAVLIPEALHSPLDHTLAIVARPDSAAARRFAEFVLGTRGRAILERHGFMVPQRP